MRKKIHYRVSCKVKKGQTTDSNLLPVGHRTAVLPLISIMQAINISARQHKKSARHGKFLEKTTEIECFLSQKCYPLKLMRDSTAFNGLEIPKNLQRCWKLEIIQLKSLRRQSKWTYPDSGMNSKKLQSIDL